MPVTMTSNYKEVFSKEVVEKIEELSEYSYELSELIDFVDTYGEDKIEYVDTKISSAETDENGITKLIDDKGKEYSADLYLDCSGFKSQLLEKTLGSEFVDYKKEGWLPNDSAVAIPTQYTNPEEECHPYTKATTMTVSIHISEPTRPY